MSSNASTPSLSILLPNLAVLLLVALGLFGNRDALVSARPTGESEAREYRTTRIRSWEDPLSIPRASASASTVLDESALADRIGRRLAEAKSTLHTHLEERGLPLRPFRQLVLPVLLPNDARDDEAEIRLRIRYAVSAALGRAQYIAAQSDRMLVGQVPVGRGSPLTLRVEFFELRYLIADDVLMPQHPHFWANLGSDGPTATSLAGRLLFPEPYDLVTVLWLDEAQLHWRAQPLASIEMAAARLFAPGSADGLKVIGPNDSGALLDWLELTPTAPAGPRVANAPVLLSPRATASEAVFRISLSTRPDLQGSHLALKTKPWLLERTIVTDDVLIEALIAELRLRDALPGRDREPDRPLFRPGQPHVAVIAEWNTLYARSMARTFAAVLEPNGSGPSGPTLDRAAWSGTPRYRSTGSRYVHEFSYMRGLDGAVAPEKDARQADNSEAGNGGADAATPGARSLTLRSAQGLNTAAGTSQLDYLRRLEAELHALDRDLRLHGDRLSAIGILGSDFYDKLLILRALKKSFPQAVFFTTDIDAGYLDRREAAFTRNLLIASAHGLTTAPALQGGTPPFRDSYQTALYLTTLKALGLQQVGGRPFAAHSSVALLAEVGIVRINLLAGYDARSDQMLRLPRTDEPGPSSSPIHPHEPAPAWSTPRRQALLAVLLAGGVAGGLVLWRTHQRFVLTITWLLAAAGGLTWLAVIGAHFRMMEVPLLTVLLYGLGALGLGVIVAGFFRLSSPVPAEDAWRRDAGRIRWPLGLGVAMGALGLLGGVAAVVLIGQDPREEPFFISEGISIWPTVLLRILALAWCVWSLFYLERLLQDVGQTLERRATGVTVHPFRESQLPAWRTYCVRTEVRARRLRVAGWMAGLLLVALALALATGAPVVPARGLMSRALEMGVLAVSTFVYLHLLFQVIDSIQSCKTFITGLETDEGAEAGRSAAEAIEVVDLLASRVGRLVYLPFTALFMLIAARNPMFDTWDWPLVLVVVFAFGLGLLVWSYLTLSTRAQEARSQAIAYLQRRLLLSARQAPGAAAIHPLPTSSPAPAAPDGSGARVITSPMPELEAEQSVAVLRAPTPIAASLATADIEHPAYWRVLIEKIRALDGVIYRPWYQSPLLGALLIPIGGTGSIKLLEQLLRAG